MDDTQSSRVSDAGAKRKRRSSILKSQRAARAPLSELEFNVATPTDTTKSRRVSFSRRTGVAEFVTNEATTTWKNFYEEHNKTLESSSNETELQPPPTVGHLARGLFHEQFLEVEAINFDTTHIHETSISDVKIDRSALECTTDDHKPCAPQQNFELSTYMNPHSKLFSDELTITGLAQVTDKISVNFSGMQLVSEDLDEMNRDVRPEFAHPGQSNMSEYVVEDLNVTHAALRGDASDMSITDTITSPKVNISRTSAITGQNDKSINKDWVVDKENIAVNPYIAPKENVNFAINEEPDKVLVFDGKRLTVQSETELLSDFRKTLLPNSVPDLRSRNKPIVLNMDDDLPNFIDNPQLTLSVHGISVSNKTLVHDADLSMTQALPGLIEPSDKQKTIVFEDGNISITETIPSDVLTGNKEKRKTIIFDDHTADVSVTQAVPKNLIFTEKKLSENTVCNDKRNTIVFEDGNISITQTLPSRVIVTDKGEVIPVKRKTIVYETDMGNISMTQVLPAASVENKSPEKSPTLAFDEDMGEISITQAVPVRIILQENSTSKRKTIVFDEEGGNVSITQAISKNLILNKDNLGDIANASITSQESKNENVDQKQIAYELETADMSVTQALPTNFLPEKRKSVVYDSADISVTQAIGSNIILAAGESNRRKTIVYDEDNADISMTEVISNMIVSESYNAIHLEKKNALILDSEPADMSVTKAIPYTMIFPGVTSEKNLSMDTNDVSMTEPVPEKILAEARRLSEALTAAKIPKDIEESSVASSSSTITDCRKTDVNEADVSANELEDINETTKSKLSAVSKQNQLITSNEILEKRRTYTNPIPSEFMSLKKDLTNKSNINAVTTAVMVYQASASSGLVCPGSETSSSAGGLIDADSKQTVSNETAGNLPSLKETTTDVFSQPDAQFKPSVNSLNYNLLTTSSAMSKIQNDVQKSILDDLLDMQENEGTEDKSVTVQLPQQSDIKLVKSEAEEGSSDSLFYIRDSAEDKSEDDRSLQSLVLKNPANHSLKTLTGAPGKAKTRAAHSVSSENSALQKEFENCIVDLEKKLLQLQQASPTRSPTRNRHFEKVISTGLDTLNNDYRRKSAKDANNTDDLLEMLSKFTDKEEEEDPLRPIEVSRPTLVENPDNRRLSTKRQSTMLSREDLLNNISMAQAALQQPCEMSLDSEPESSPDRPPRKAVRLSPEVIKTLRFEDDETMSEESALTPLKKTAFGETAYMTERNVSKVIPNYLQDVSDGIKELMDDLVKPNADVLPFETTSVGREVKRSTSTCSTQIQANLITSSQIDLEPEPIDWTSPGAVLSSGMRKLKGIMKTSINPSTSELGTASERSFDVDWKDEDSKYYNEVGKYYSENSDFPDSQGEERRAVDQSIPGQVIVFDPSNPLNNVLLAPINLEDAHRYYPPTPKESTCSADVEPQKGTVTFDLDVQSKDRVSENYNVATIVPDLARSIHASPKEFALKMTSDSFTSADPIETSSKSVKDAEINTVIAMKENKNLLQISSSLTLVDESAKPPIGPYCGDLDSGTSKDVSPSSSLRISPVHVIYSQKKEELDYTDSDSVSMKSCSNLKRRHANKHKDCTLSALDVTPKPASKIVKLSQSPRNNISPKKNLDKTPIVLPRVSPTTVFPKGNKLSQKTIALTENPTEPKSPKSKRMSHPKLVKPGTNITVNQLLTEYNMYIDMSHVEEGKDVAESESNEVSGPVSSASDAPYATGCEMAGDTEAPSEASVASDQEISPADWQPDLINEVPSKVLVTEMHSDEDIIAKIDALPFMGSKECKWESADENCWSFLLLLGRLRLKIELASTDTEAGRGRVRADTPVTDVIVETVTPEPSGNSNALAALCVRFAAESVRRLSARRRARDAAAAPALLRLAAGAARAALRWGRAMHRAALHLAYSLTAHGLLTLKVANVPLRSVWEVSMSLEMAGDAEPWPRAAAVRVTPLLGDVTLAQPELQRALARLRNDWGHAPRTLWKVFKYLKNKTRNDELLLGM